MHLHLHLHLYLAQVSDCKDISMEPLGEPVKNEANYVTDEWHHKYTVHFRVAASTDPQSFLALYFDKTIKQLGDAAVKISYVQTEELPK